MKSNKRQRTDREGEVTTPAALSTKKQKPTEDGTMVDGEEESAAWMMHLLNTRSIETLLNADENRFVLQKHTSFSHVNGDHDPAVANFTEFNLQCPNIATLKLKRESYYRFSSQLLQEFTDETDGDICQVTVEAEADVCQLVRSAAKDAIGILVREPESLVNLKKHGKISIRMERSLFGCRPDVMVVRDKNKVGLLAIEVKFPPGHPLAGYRNVLGHSFDHAMSMNAFNMGTDLVLLTSFEESHLCSLNQGDLQFQSRCAAQGSTKHATPQQQRVQTPQQTQSPPIVTEAQEAVFLTADQNNQRALPSVTFDNSSVSMSTPPSDGSSPCDESKTKDLSSEGPWEGFTPTISRELFVSTESYKAHELVKLIYTALKIADKVYKAKAKTILRLEPNKLYYFPRTLRIVTGPAKKGAKSYCWGSLHATLGQPVASSQHAPIKSKRIAKRQPMANDSDSFYIIGSLGQGVTSNVFQALTSRGEHVALKIYVKNVKNDSSLMTADEFEEAATAATENEVANLLELYPCLVGKVRVVKFMKFHCVVMPIFEPIQKSERDTTEVLEKIQEVLQDFEKKNLMYEDDDIRWRHVGTYSNGVEKHHILYDVANLKPSGGEEFAASHFEILKERISEEKPSTGEGLFGATEQPQS